MDPATHLRRWIGVVVTAVALAACTQASGDPSADETPVKVEKISGSDRGRVTLTDAAAKRIDLQTAVVRRGPGTGTQMPYAAFLYDPDGKTWTFVKSGKLSFERRAVTVDHVEGDTAFLSAGPEVGTEVATVGAVQLYGAEQGVGEDE